jgi:hypothetical protein
MEPDALSTYSQEPTTGICPGPNEQFIDTCLVSLRTILIWSSHQHLHLLVCLIPLGFLRFLFCKNPISLLFHSIPSTHKIKLTFFFASHKTVCMFYWLVIWKTSTKSCGRLTFCFIKHNKTWFAEVYKVLHRFVDVWHRRITPKVIKQFWFSSVLILNKT